MPKKIKILITLCLLFILLSSCSKKVENSKLIIFHAGSLTVPMDEIIKSFNQEYPGIIVEREIAGSRECARKIADLKKPCDIMASADYAVIDTLLIPEYATWNIQFAANEMAIVYSEKSHKADMINAENWYQILLDPEVRYGRSDPDADPCGYRAIFTMQLAEKYYQKPGLSTQLFTKDNQYIRPKEVDLLALLEVQELDYLFLYRSVARQHGLKALRLPGEINLSNPAFTTLYRTVQVKISGKNPGEKMTITGDPMVYGVTIPITAPHYKQAVNFVRFLLNKDKGLAILEQNDQPPIIPPKTPSLEQIPETIRNMVVQLSEAAPPSL